jgi:hypothetical protein
VLLLLLLCADYGAVPAACALNGSRFQGREICVATSTPLNKDVPGAAKTGKLAVLDREPAMLAKGHASSRHACYSWRLFAAAAAGTQC